MEIAGKNPPAPVAIGRASMPTPTVVAAIRSVPPKTDPFDLKRCMKFLLLWRVIKDERRGSFANSQGFSATAKRKSALSA